MPAKRILQRVAQDRRKGKAPSTQAGEFVREEIEHIRRGKHGARSTKQAIAIGLSKARRAGVALPLPKKGTVSSKTHRAAELADAIGRHGAPTVSPARSRAISAVLKREGHRAASKQALAKHAHAAARRRKAGERSAAAAKSARTKGAVRRSIAAKKAARTRLRKRLRT